MGVDKLFDSEETGEKTLELVLPFSFLIFVPLTEILKDYFLILISEDSSYHRPWWFFWT